MVRAFCFVLSTRINSSFPTQKHYQTILQEIWTYLLLGVCCSRVFFEYGSIFRRTAYRLFRTMDPTFYEDQLASLQQRPSPIRDVKPNMTLDVSSTAQSVATDPCVIRLSSPEFERFIVQQEQGTASTPTAILFPRSVTQVTLN